MCCDFKKSFDGKVEKQSSCIGEWKKINEIQLDESGILKEVMAQTGKQEMNTEVELNKKIKRKGRKRKEETKLCVYMYLM